MYLQLPAGLSKIRYEQEAWKFVQPAINGLRLRQLQFIKDILPFSKMVIFLKTVECPNFIIDTCKDIVTALKKMAAAPTGMPHKPTIKAMTKRREIIDEEEEEEEEVTVDGIAIASTEAADEEKPWTAPKEEVTITTINNDMVMDKHSLSYSYLNTEQDLSMESMTPEMRADTTLPGRLLEYHTEKGDWTVLKSPSEQLLLHAAFLVTPHVIPVPDGAEDDELTEREMGHNAFKNYIKTLQRADRDTERREITRSRFRAALILATPFTLNLQAEGNYIVEDLLTINLPDMQMPKLLQMQVESLLTIAVGLACNSKAAKVNKNYESSEKGDFDVPMVYDPKFQRGPLDPYGRPPRLEGLDKLFKNKRKKTPAKTTTTSFSGGAGGASSVVKGSNLEADSLSSDLPIGIWEPPKPSPSKEIRRVWKFHSINSLIKGQHAEEDNDGITWAGTGTTDQATKRLLPDVRPLPGSPSSSIEVFVSRIFLSSLLYTFSSGYLISISFLCV